MRQGAERRRQFCQNKALWMVSREGKSVIIRKDQVEFIIEDNHIDGDLYDFTIFFTSGHYSEIDGEATEIILPDVYDWLNT